MSCLKVAEASCCQSATCSRKIKNVHWLISFPSWCSVEARKSPYLVCLGNSISMLGSLLKLNHFVVGLIKS